MNPGDLVRWSFPQADGKSKARPAILLLRFELHGDWLACGVSTSLGLFMDGLDILIDEDHPDFGSMELPRPSLIRTGFLDTIPSKSIEGSFGKVRAETVRQLRGNLAERLLRVEDLAL